MPRPIGKNDIVAAIHTLGLAAKFNVMMARSRQAASHQVARQLLHEFKNEAEEDYKALAMKHHPDRGGEAKNMQQINAAWDIVKTLNVRPAPPRHQMPVIVRVNIDTMGPSTTTSYTTGGFSSSFRVWTTNYDPDAT